MNTTGLKSITQTIGGTITKNSPTILTGLSVAGMLTTTILAVKATPKALQILEDEKEIREDEKEIREAAYTEIKDIPPKDVIALTWKCYAPAAIMGGITIACIVGANSINLRRNAALAGAYSLTETALKEYKAKVVETIGKNKEQEVRDEIVKDKLVKNPLSSNEVIITGKGDSLCYDSLSGRYFMGDKERIISATNSLNRRLRSDMFISLNEVYSELNLDGTRLGDMVGWGVDDEIDPCFSAQIAENGQPCIVLDFREDPKPCDRSY